MRKRISPTVAAVFAAMLAAPALAATTAGTNGSTVTATTVAPAATPNATTSSTTFGSSSMSLSAPPPSSTGTVTLTQAPAQPTSSNPTTTTQTSSFPTPSNSTSAVLNGPRDTTSGTVSGQATPGGPASTAVAEGVQANTTTEENATNANITAAANTTGELAPLGGTGNTGTTNPTTGIATNGAVLADTLVSGLALGEDFVVGPNGERIPANRASNTTIVAANTITPTPEINVATRRVANETHRKVARNEQLMHSIAPRTDVDRAWQMPDDPTPLFSR